MLHALFSVDLISIPSLQLWVLTCLLMKLSLILKYDLELNSLFTSGPSIIDCQLLVSLLICSSFDTCASVSGQSFDVSTFSVISLLQAQDDF